MDGADVGTDVGNVVGADVGDEEGANVGFREGEGVPGFTRTYCVLRKHMKENNRYLTCRV